MKLPPEHDLLQLFGAEPALLDAGVPWAYNTVTFTTRRGADEIECVLTPGYGGVALAWRREGRVIAQFALARVAAVCTRSDNSAEALVIAFEEKSALADFVLQLEPFVKVDWR